MEGEPDSMSTKLSKYSNTGMYFRRPCRLAKNRAFLVGPNTFYLSFEFHEMRLIHVTPQPFTVGCALLNISLVALSFRHHGHEAHRASVTNLDAHRDEEKNRHHSEHRIRHRSRRDEEPLAKYTHEVSDDHRRSKGIPSHHREVGTGKVMLRCAGLFYFNIRS